MNTEIESSTITIRSAPGIRVRSAGREVGMKSWPHLLQTSCVLQCVLTGFTAGLYLRGQVAQGRGPDGQAMRVFWELRGKSFPASVAALCWLVGGVSPGGTRNGPAV